MSKETVLSNARIVLEDDILSGAILIRDGKIADISEGSSVAGEDFEGDYIIPGLVELHTDHLEGHYSPRPGIRWNKTAAVQAHDAQIVTSGITTVFDCLRMGADEDGGFEHGEMREMADAIQSAEKEGRLRAEHLFRRARAERERAEGKIVAIAGNAIGQRAAQFQPRTQPAERLCGQRQRAVVLDFHRVMARQLEFRAQDGIGVLVSPFALQGTAQQRVPVGNGAIAVQRVGGEMPFERTGEARG